MFVPSLNVETGILYPDHSEETVGTTAFFDNNISREIAWDLQVKSRQGDSGAINVFLKKKAAMDFSAA